MLFHNQNLYQWKFFPNQKKSILLVDDENQRKYFENPHEKVQIFGKEVKILLDIQ